MKTHYLKCWPQFFGPSWTGQKGFEFRKNDRGFQEGDLLVLQEWSPALREYTGREIDARVTYIMGDLSHLHVPIDLADYVIMSITKEETREGVKRGEDRPIPPHPCGIQLQPPPLPTTSPFETQDKLLPGHDHGKWVPFPPPQERDDIIKEGETVTVTDITQDLKAELEAADREKADILAAHKEMLLIAHNLSMEATEKVAMAHDLVKEHAKAVKQVAALKKELENIQKPSPAYKEIERLEGLINDEDATIEKHQRLLVAFDTYHKDLAASLEAESKLPRLREMVDVNDTLVKGLSPGGIPSEMILEALEGLNGHLAEAAEYLFPDRTLQVNEGLGIDLEGTPYTTLSKSTKFRVGVAFQYALARLAGARVLMIDEADILDHIGRVELINFLMTQLYNFDQVLVFFTADRPFVSPVADNWWLERGVIQKVVSG